MPVYGEVILRYDFRSSCSSGTTPPALRNDKRADLIHKLFLLFFAHLPTASRQSIPFLYAFQPAVPAPLSVLPMFVIFICYFRRLVKLSVQDLRGVLGLKTALIFPKLERNVQEE